MIKTKKLKNGILILLLVGLLLLKIRVNTGISTQVTHIEKLWTEDKLNSAGLWNLTGFPIFINNTDVNYNWTKVSDTYDWCNGSGSWKDPYIIENILIDGLSSSNCIEIINSNVSFIIRNCTLFNSGPSRAGIRLSNVNNSRITSNIHIYNNEFGIFYYGGCYNNTIENNSVSNNVEDGIKLENYCNFNMISHNELGNNEDGIGLYNNCANNTIVNNYMHDNKYNGLILRDSCINNSIIFNDLIDNDDANILLRYGCNENLIEGNYIVHAPFDGIYLDDCDYNIIRNNTILDNYSLSLYPSGIDIDSHSDFNFIVNNTIHNIRKNGIYFEWYSDNNIVINNTISQCDRGIWSIQSSSYLNITQNIFRNCEVGIFLNSGTDNSIIYNNQLINQYNAFDYGNNQWDYNGIGNYWNDYSGIDDNDDGIGDTPHLIENAIDYFPIWWDPPEFNIMSPINLTVFTDTYPNYTISIVHGIIDTIWYQINQSESYYISNLSGSINIELWNSFNDGLLILTFYINDSKGYISSKSVSVIKDNIEEPNLPAIPGYNVCLLLMLVGIISVVLLRKRLKS